MSTLVVVVDIVIVSVSSEHESFLITIYELCLRYPIKWNYFVVAKVVIPVIVDI